MKVKIVFFCSDKYSQIVLNELQQNQNFEIIKIFKNKNDLNNDLEKLTKPDVGIVASFGALIPKDIISWPKKGLLNLHPSLLPKYRGPTPVPAAILNGEKETGLTIIQVDEQIDHGPIVAQFKEAIKPEDTSESLLQRLFKMGAEVLTTILPAYLEGKIKLREQNHFQATYTQKLTREDGKMNWSKSADYLERFVRAMYPWPGAWTEIKLKMKNEKLKIKRLKILKTHLENGKLVLNIVQLEGKKPVNFKQFLEGYPQFEFLS